MKDKLLDLYYSVKFKIEDFVWFFKDKVSNLKNGAEDVVDNYYDFPLEKPVKKKKSVKKRKNK